MRSLEEHQAVMDLWKQGMNTCQIARTLDIPRPTAKDIIKRYQNRPVEAGYRVTPPDQLLKQIMDAIDTDENTIAAAYAYVLGIYLGDGCISKVRNVYSIRIALDARYPGIIQTCQNAIQQLLPNNSVGITRVMDGDRLSCVHVRCLYKHWPTVFPQHGEGKKHLRPIKLENWQQQVVETYPLEFFRGLFHSDGSRFANIVNGKDYPRYQFSNCSRDIIDLFIAACEKLGVHYTEKIFQKSGYVPRTDVFISKRKDVAYLDSVIGPKA